MIAYHADDFVNDDAVFEHEQVHVKQIALVRAHVGRDPVLDFLDLGARLDQHLLEAFDLHRDFIVRQFAARDEVTDAVQHENFPATNAGRYGDAAKHLFTLGLR